MESFYHDDETLEAFVRRLARATEYTSRDTGTVLDDYWKEEAQEWVRELDSKS